jgi:hypothetical protein
MLRALRFFLPLLCFLGSLHAQSARWEPSSGNLPRDQVSQLALIFEDAEPKDEPTPPAVDGLTFGRPGRSEQTINLGFGNGAIRRRILIYTYPVRPTRADGEVRIPAFTVETSAGSLSVPAAGFRLSAATVGQSGTLLDDIARARFDPPAAPIWAGEVFPLEFILEVDRRYATNNILGGPLEWAPSPLVAEEWSKPAGAEVVVDGQQRLRVTIQTRAAAPATGSATQIPLPTATQLIQLPTGNANPFSIFGQGTYEQRTVSTAAARIAVNPLPSPAPADFIGAVGRFTLRSTVVPEKATVGEPITWTLTLEGTGNWPAIDRLRPRTLSRDFRVVSPRAQKTPQGTALFDASLSEDLILIPQKPGRHTLGPYTLSVFNPLTGAYETLRAEPVQIEITPGAAGVGSSSATSGADTPAASGETPAPGATLPPPAPAGPVATLPSDPLAPGLLATAPLGAWPRPLFWTPLALLLPAALWLFLAGRHARRHDPLRERRAAHAELRQVLARLEAGANAADLLAWQHATRVLLDLPSLTPTARDLRDPLWAALWAETERALYRPSTPLAAEWAAQAWLAHAQAAPPPRRALAALRPAHLFARAAVWALVVHAGLLAAPSTFAADPAKALAAYARGDFPAAETGLRTALAEAPLDAALRHNLALALAQQGRWDEAAAHAYAASLHRPGDPALGRLLAATTPKATYRIQLPPTAARVLSVRGWQHLALGAALALLALAPAAYLLALHSPGAGRRVAWLTGHGVVLLAAAGLAASLLALRAHGPATHPAAVLVWRPATLRALPTDAGQQKVTAELPAGTLARVDKAFLGWRRLVLPDGNTGWVRAEPLVPLWR